MITLAFLKNEWEKRIGKLYKNMAEYKNHLELKA